jgi:hypothetical protein
MSRASATLGNCESELTKLAATSGICIAKKLAHRLGLQRAA